MKAIEELDVSPMPWREASYGLIVSSDNKKVADFCCSGYDPKVPDFIMMMSAPRLYKELWNICFGDVPIFNCRKCHGVRFGPCKSCFLFEARAALEEACGDVNNDAGGDNLADRVRDCLDEVAPSEEAQRLLNEDGLK